MSTPDIERLFSPAIKEHLTVRQPDVDAEQVSLNERRLAERRRTTGQLVTRLDEACRRPSTSRRLARAALFGLGVSPLSRAPRDPLVITIGSEKHTVDGRDINLEKVLTLHHPDHRVVARLSATTSEVGKVDPEAKYGTTSTLMQIVDFAGSDIAKVIVPRETRGFADRVVWENLADPDDPRWEEIQSILGVQVVREGMAPIAAVHHARHEPRSRGGGSSGGNMNMTMIAAATGGP